MKITEQNNLSIYWGEHLRTHNLFFDKIILEFNLEKVDADIIAVLHLLLDAIPFTTALSKIGNLKTIIPKPKSINKKVLHFLTKTPVKIIDRSQINEELKNIKQKTIFLDIGGYFSQYTFQLHKNKSNFVGIVEDTENGLQKYQNGEINFLFLSVARSPLKDNEDLLVGGAIAYSVERILRGQNIIINGMNLGVIGFGKIGSSVAKNFIKKQSRVSVFDKNNVLLTHALSQGFLISKKEDILSHSDLICLSTGNQVLSKDDFVKIKTGSFIFSVTSSDDSFDKEWLESNYNKSLVAKTITKYTCGEHYFYLLNDGETINFVHGTTVGEFILLVHAELLLSAYKLLKGEIKGDQQELDNKSRNKIAEIWLNIFGLNVQKTNSTLHNNLIEALAEYKNTFPNENIHTLLEYAKSTLNCISRENQDGHFTASGLVIDKGKILLVFHNKLQKYLQPGGHLEDEDLKLIGAAKREVEEETRLKVKSHSLFGDSPVHIDIHKIPENKKKDGPEHFHYDCMFVFELADTNTKLKLQDEEVSAYKWVPLDYDFKDTGIRNAIAKIKKLI